MRNKKAFSSSIEFILITLLCAIVAFTSLAFFSKNLSQLFTSDRHYKSGFSRQME